MLKPNISKSFRNSKRGGCTADSELSQKPVKENYDEAIK